MPILLRQMGLKARMSDNGSWGQEQQSRHQTMEKPVEEEQVEAWEEVPTQGGGEEEMQDQPLEGLVPCDFLAQTQEALM